MPKKRKCEGLTPREKEVLELMCKPLTEKEIAQVMFITRMAVKYHKANIFKKLNLRSTYEVLASYIFKQREEIDRLTLDLSIVQKELEDLRKYQMIGLG